MLSGPRVMTAPPLPPCDRCGHPKSLHDTLGGECYFSFEIDNGEHAFPTAHHCACESYLHPEHLESRRVAGGRK